MASFDTHAESYCDSVERSIAFSGQELGFFARRKAALLLELCERLVGDPAALTLLDVGCGIGVTDSFLIGRGGRVLGVDTSRDSIERARTRNPLGEYQAYNGGRLPYPDASVDVAFVICVLHHVTPSERGGLLREMWRVVRSGGLAVVFEHNPLNPLTRLAVSRCEFDRDAVLLRPRETARLLDAAGFGMIERRYIIFFTFDRPRSVRVERALGSFPAGAQYYAAARR